MINWKRTEELFGNVRPLSKNPKVVKQCDSCGIEAQVNYKGGKGKPCHQYYCKKCAIRKPGVLEKVKANTIKQWKNPEFAEKALQSLENNRNNPDIKAKMASVSKRPEMIETLKLHNEKQRTIPMRSNAAQKYANQPRCSSLQKILYSILDDLNIKHYREYEDKPSDKECVIGPYTFDCVVPRDMKPTLLIECQGDWHHTRPGKDTKDTAKASYISNNFPNQYELKCIWEHEFSCKDKIVESIKYWMGISSISAIDFDFNNISIRECIAKDYKLLLSKYHYLANAGRGGIAYGAYLNNELIAVCVFSPLIRQNVVVEGFKQEETRELSRLCIHPLYQKKNFASWFVSRCIKQLNPIYKCIVSYCDKTFNHDGTVYKAVGFVYDKIVMPDYWYVDTAGWVMHKKTLYNRAKAVHLTESEFAVQHNYTKVYGKEKLRFVYKR